MASQVVKIEKSISVLGHSLLKSESRQVADPQKETGQSEGRVIEPPYDPEKIAELVQLSSILPQCISAMVIGCERKYLITVADATGALKVNEIRDKIGTLLGMDLEKLPDEFGELPRLFSQYVDNSNDLNNLNKSQLFKALWKIREGLKK